MEKCSSDLKKQMQLKEDMTSRRFETDEILELAVQMSQASGYLHSIKKIHRDIKPPNILIDFHGGEPLRPLYKLTDFGTVYGYNPTYCVLTLFCLYIR